LADLLVVQHGRDCGFGNARERRYIGDRRVLHRRFAHGPKGKEKWLLRCLPEPLQSTFAVSPQQGRSPLFGLVGQRTPPPRRRFGGVLRAAPERRIWWKLSNQSKRQEPVQEGL